MDIDSENDSLIKIEFLDENSDDVLLQDLTTTSSATSGPEHSRPKKKTFQKPEVDALIILYKNHLNDFRNQFISNDQIWNEICLELKSEGFELTPNQCKFKFQSLKKIYKQLKNGADPTRLRFDYYREFEEMFGTTFNTVDDYENIFYDSDGGDISTEVISKLWTPFETQKLIEQYQQFHAEYPPNKESDTWNSISERLNKTKLNVTPVQCQNRWKGLVRFYKDVIENNRQKTKLFFRIENAIKVSANTPEKLQGIRENKIKTLHDELQKKIQMKEKEIEQILIKDNFLHINDDHSYPEERLEEPETLQYTIEDIFEEKVEDCDGSPPAKRKKKVLETEEIPEDMSVEYSIQNNAKFQNEILSFLQEKEKARQKRHQENLEIKAKKIKLLEKLINNVNK